MRVLIILLLVTLITKCQTHTLRQLLDRKLNRYGPGGTGQEGYTYEVHEVRNVDMSALAGLTKPGDVVIVEVVEESQPQQNRWPMNHPAFINHKHNHVVPQTAGHSNAYYTETSWNSGNNGNNKFQEYSFNENSFGPHGGPQINSQYYPSNQMNFVPTGHNGNIGQYNNRKPMYEYQNNAGNQNSDQKEHSDANKQSEENTTNKPNFIKDEGTTKNPVENIKKDPVTPSTENPDEFSIDIRAAVDDVM